MTATISQTDGLLALLQLRGEAGVTPLEALDELGCFRLAARVSDLRALGWAIENRGKHHARYVLLRESTPWMRTAVKPAGSEPPPLTEAEQRMFWGDR